MDLLAGGGLPLMIHGNRPLLRRGGLLALVLAVLVQLAGCAAVISRATDPLADNLTQAILNHDDPATVAAAVPTYLVLLDSLLQSAPEDPGLLLASATLHSAFAGNFVTAPARAQRLHGRALGLALQAACLGASGCSLRSQPYGAFEAWVRDQDDTAMLYTLGTTWAGYVQAHSANWQAVAELARVRALLERVLALDEGHEHGGAHLYLGVLDTLVPPALGGRPEAGRRHFERAWALSGQRHLTAKVLLAERYARLLFDRDLHDEALREVLAADPEAPGLTLANHLAQAQARALLADADSYF
jgi:uncharacterized protein YceK